MKHILATLMIFALAAFVSLELQAQSPDGYPITSWVLKDGTHCRNSPVEVTVRLVTTNDEMEVYSEKFNTTTNDRGQYSVAISQGEVLNGEFDIEYLKDRIHYKILVDVKVDCMGEETEVNAIPVSNPVIPVAEDADAWGGMEAPDEDTEEATNGEILEAEEPYYAYAVCSDGFTERWYKINPGGQLEEVDEEDLPGYEEADAVEPTDVKGHLEDNSDQKIIVPDGYGNKWIFGPNGGIINISDYPNAVPMNNEIKKITDDSDMQWDLITPLLNLDKEYVVLNTNPDPPGVSSKVAFEFQSLELPLQNAMLVHVEDGSRDKTGSDQTGAIFGSNPLGTAGVVGRAAGSGIIGEGPTGVFGVQLPATDVNGAGVHGAISSVPSSGNFNYALVGNANGLSAGDNVFAAFHVGDTYRTGEDLSASDARLKKGIRSHASMLDKVLQVQPRSYEYIQESVLGLPDGVQHGFIAQELEQVFPEMVTDILMPTTFEQSEFASAETVSYKAVNYEAMIPVLTSALQELNEKVEAQNAEIERLSAIVKQLNKD